MFTKYVYSSGSALSDVKSDIQALLTGTTDKNSLSSSCNKLQTVITSTVAAGWTVNSSYPTTTGVKQYVAGNQQMTVSGVYNAKPVNNGSYILWPVMGSNKILKSTDQGASWSEITLPVTLGLNNFSNGFIQNLTWISSLNIWVLTDPTTSLSSIWIGSSDGTTWTTKSTTSAQQWHTPVWNGSICVITALNSCQAITYSTDGATWTYSGTALPSSSYWGTPVYGNGIWVVTINNINSATSQTSVLATSSNGITWTSRTVGSYYWWTPQFVNGVFVSMMFYSTLGTYFYVSTDGITWTGKNLSYNAYWHQPVWNGSIWVLSARNYNSSAYFWYSYDGINWTQGSYIGNAVSYGPPIYSSAIGLWILPNMGTTTYYTSPDGITWTSRTNSITGNSFDYYLTPSGVSLIVSDGKIWSTSDGLTWVSKNSLFSNSNLYGYSTNNYFGKFFQSTKYQYFCYNLGSAYIGVPNVANTSNNFVVKSVNADGTTYKNVVIDVSNDKVLMETSEDLTSSSVLNNCISSDDPNSAQQLDLNNGGILYIGAKANYIAMLSYLPTTMTIGNSQGYFSAVCEYSRDDAWTSASGYPTHGFLNTISNTLYIPRMRYSLAIDYTGTNAKLTPFFGNPLTKKVWNTQNILVAPSMDIRFSNTINTNSILGGVLLGGIKQTMSASGANTDEFTIGANTYFVMTGASSYVYLIPKE